MAFTWGIACAFGSAKRRHPASLSFGGSRREASHLLTSIRGCMNLAVLGAWATMPLLSPMRGQDSTKAVLDRHNLRHRDPFSGRGQPCSSASYGFCSA
jgi:hypothetical protein